MSKQTKFTPLIPIYVQLSIDELADALGGIDVDVFMRLVMAMSDRFAMVEIDEELVARHWRAVQAGYGKDETPTLDEILERFPEEKKR